MATQVSQIKTEILSPSTKPINPFSIESILKSEPPSPQSSADTSEESTTDSDASSNLKPAAAAGGPRPVFVNSQVAWLLYQAQLQQYWRCLLISNLQKNAGTARKQVPVYKPVLIADGGKPVAVGQKHTRSILKMQNASRGAKRHDVITPSTEKKIKLELDMKDNSLLSQKDRPLLTREEYDSKCSKALPILHSDYSLSSESVLSNKIFLEMVDINKVLDLSVTDLNAIIDNSTFTDEERAYIRELRRKAMNKKAAEECRRRKKSEEQHLTEEFESLVEKKKLLMSDKGRLQQEISTFKQTVGVLAPLEEAEPSVTLKHEPMDVESPAQVQLN